MMFFQFNKECLKCELSTDFRCLEPKYRNDKVPQISVAVPCCKYTVTCSLIVVVLEESLGVLYVATIESKCMSGRSYNHL